MDKQAQDKRWNDLSDTEKNEFRFWYKESSEVDPLSEFDKGKLYGAELIFGSHNLNPKPLTYEDVAKELFGRDNTSYWINNYGNISHGTLDSKTQAFLSENNCVSEKQAEKLLAINKLLNVAKFLNGDWKPDMENKDEQKWYFEIYHETIGLEVTGVSNCSIVYFRTEELAEKAAEILGEDVVRLALTTEF